MNDRTFPQTPSADPAGNEVLSPREIETLPTEELLTLYKRTGQQEYKWPLVLRYTGMIKNIALRVTGVYNGFAQLDDIVNEGIITLMSAIDKYDPERGTKFETYASKRIRGMIIDLVRRQDWLPRSVRKRSQEIDQAVNELCGMLGRFPTDREVADRMGIGLEKYQGDLASTALSGIVSLEMLFERRKEGDTGISLTDTYAGHQPEDRLLRVELREKLAEGIGSLQKNEQLVLSLYYEKGLNMRAIAQILGVSEPRVSQIHSRAIQKLRVYLESYLNATV